MAMFENGGKTSRAKPIGALSGNHQTANRTVAAAPSSVIFHPKNRLDVIFHTEGLQVLRLFAQADEVNG